MTIRLTGSAMDVVLGVFRLRQGFAVVVVLGDPVPTEEDPELVHQLVEVEL